MMPIALSSSPTRDPEDVRRWAFADEPAEPRAILTGSSSGMTAESLEKAAAVSSAGGKGLGPSSSRLAPGSSCAGDRVAGAASSPESCGLAPEAAALFEGTCREFQPPRTGTAALSSTRTR